MIRNLKQKELSSYLTLFILWTTVYLAGVKPLFKAVERVFKTTLIIPFNFHLRVQKIHSIAQIDVFPAK